MAITMMEKMTKARAGLIIDQRFFGALTLKLQLVEDPKGETMYTDGKVLGFNPAWVETLTMDETKGVICHEVMHCVSGHHTRRGDRDNSIWNQACDLVINPILIEAGLTLPKGMLFDKGMEGKSADEVYSILNGRKPKQDQSGKDGDSNKGQQQGSSPQNNPQGKDKNDKGESPSNGNGKGEKGKGKADPGGCGEVRDQKADDGAELNETDKAKEEQDWKIAVTAAANAAEGCGQMKGGVKQLVRDLTDSKVPWTEVLQRFVDQIAKNDYSYARTNARYAAHGIIMPSLYNKELPPIDVCLDTSGSCFSPEDQKQFISEINDIRQHYATKIRLVYCDTAVQGVQTIEQHDPLEEFEIKGGGGTKFSPALKHCSEQEEQPVCVIYMTDMDCNDFGKEPDYPVLWIQVKGRKRLPPWGEHVMMHPKPF